MTRSVLDEIVDGVRADLAERQATTSLDDLKAAALKAPEALDPMPRFRASGVGVIAEVKRSSPSKGALAAITDPAALARDYESGGAATISVLTEQRRFGGSLDDLRAVRAAVKIPVLRKDFIVTSYQLLEARAAGADAILLIVAALTDAELSDLSAAARSLGLAALVEVHDLEECDRALAAGASIIGVNNRNLRTLRVDLDASRTIAARIPKGVIGVSESGLKTRDDLQAMTALGYQAFLVGERFMVDPDPGAALASLIETMGATA